MLQCTNMNDSPRLLEDLCLECVCDNILKYIEPQPQSVGKGNVWWNKDDSSDDKESFHLYKFRDPDIFLINEISEKLLQKLHEKRMLNDATLNIFNGHNTKLKSVRLKNCKVTQIGLKILKEHKIVDLECVEMKFLSIGDVCDSLNSWSFENMTNANFSKCTFIDMSRFSLMVKITNLKNLHSLNLSYTELNQNIFTMICEELQLLEKLDISQTQVKHLDPLVALADRLVSLTICDLPQAKRVMETLRQMTRLRHLDVSVHMDKPYNYEHFKVAELVADTETLPELVSLDVSGWKDCISKSALLNYLDARPKLQFLGIVLDSITFDPDVCQHGHLKIAGFGDEDQIKLTLKKYLDRSNYVQKALYYLFQLSNRFKEARPDILNLVLPVMEAHPNKFGVQMASTACLYNLTRGEMSKHIHPHYLSKGVKLTLYAMETFPDEFQLQKNSLLILCSDRILQDINFDRFACAKLVLDALCAFDDINMNRMAVAICGILAAKVTTEQTSELGARQEYMRKLLAMVLSRVDNCVSDITLKFTLSTLWNLTDESAATCEVFLEQGGDFLFLNVLKTFENDCTIETKVLGLLNNIAEVSRLRSHLMVEALMCELFRLLKSDNIDVSYFAAGIIAHLASDGEEKWTLGRYTRKHMLQELLAAVSEWREPEGEMVAYRSFRPFFPLLRVDMDHQVQMWAVWAIHHVCTKNPKRYCLMLKEENGHLLLCDLVKCTDSNPKIINLCSQILDTLENSGV